MCILTGCDYMKNGVSGIGLKKAEDFFFRTSKSDLREILPKIPFYMKMTSLKISKGIVENFIRAENTFLHQIVFDPIKKELRPLNPYPEESRENSFSYAGSIITSTDALRLALGNNLSLPQDKDEYFLPVSVPSSSIWSTQHLEFINQKPKILQSKENNQVENLNLKRSTTSTSEDHFKKKSRLSLNETSATKPKNSVTNNWNADDWIREYRSFKPCLATKQPSSSYAKANDFNGTSFPKSPYILKKKGSQSLSPVLSNSQSPGKKIPPSLLCNPLNPVDRHFPSVTRILTSIPIKRIVPSPLSHISVDSDALSKPKDQII